MRIPRFLREKLLDARCQVCGNKAKMKLESEKTTWGIGPRREENERISNVRNARKIKKVAKGLDIPPGDAMDILMYQQGKLQGNHFRRR